MFHHFTNKRMPPVEEEFDILDLDLELGQVYEKDGVVYAKPFPAKPLPATLPSQIVMENVLRKEEAAHETSEMPECIVHLWDIFSYVRIVCSDARTVCSDARNVCSTARSAFSTVRQHLHET